MIEEKNTSKETYHREEVIKKKTENKENEKENYFDITTYVMYKSNVLYINYC